MTVSNMLRKDELLEEEAGATTVVGSKNSSAIGSLDRGLGAAPVEDSTLWRLELAFN